MEIQVAKSFLARIRAYASYYVQKLKGYTDIYNYTDYFYKHYGMSATLRGILFFLYFKSKRLLTNLTKEHVIEVNGCRVSTVPNDRGISVELLFFKTHEPLTTELLKKELKKGMVCLDIGSNIGYYALLERKIVGSEGRVIAIEPSPLTFSYLKKNICQNRFSDVETFKFAISGSNGEVPFLINAHSNWSRVVDENYCSLESVILKVPSRTLDSFATQCHLDKLDFLRMDVEGHEVQIFSRGWHTIERFKPILLIEVHTLQIGLKGTVDFLQSLKSRGYAVKYYIPRELDTAFIGSMEDVQEIDIIQIIEKLIEKQLPETFHLFLVNTHGVRCRKNI